MSVNPEELMAQLEAMVNEKVTEKVAQALEEEGFEVASPFQTAVQNGLTFQEVLDDLDPADGEASMAMYAWLTRYGRLNRVGTLEGGGHLFIYSEPKGSTKEGYVAGGTQGDRIVDAALSHAEAATNGAGPTRKTLCGKCLNTVEIANGGKPFTDGDPTHTVCTQNNSGPHVPVD